MGATSDKKSSKGKDEDDEEARKKKKMEEEKAEMEEKLQAKTYDWIEKLLEKAEKTIKKWQDAITRMWNFTNKNWATNKAIAENRNQIVNQQRAYGAYMEQAKIAAKKAGMTVESDESTYTNKYVGGYNLKKDYIYKIANGSWEIEDIPNKTLQAKIDAFQEW